MKLAIHARIDAFMESFRLSGPIPDCRGCGTALQPSYIAPEHIPIRLECTSPACPHVFRDQHPRRAEADFHLAVGSTGIRLEERTAPSRGEDNVPQVRKALAAYLPGGSIYDARGQERGADLVFASPGASKIDVSVTRLRDPVRFEARARAAKKGESAPTDRRWQETHDIVESSIKSKSRVVGRPDMILAIDCTSFADLIPVVHSGAAGRDWALEYEWGAVIFVADPANTRLSWTSAEIIRAVQGARGTGA